MRDRKFLGPEMRGENVALEMMNQKVKVNWNGMSECKSVKPNELLNHTTKCGLFCTTQPITVKKNPANCVQLSNCSQLRIEVLPTAFRTETLILSQTVTSSIPWELWLWPIHMQKVRVRGSLGSKVSVETDGRTDGRRRLYAKAVGTNGIPCAVDGAEPICSYRCWLLRGMSVKVK